MTVEIKSSRLGVPYLIDGDEVIPLAYQHVGDIIALEFTEPGIINRLQWALREAAEEIAGIDATLPDDDWHQEFGNVLLLNELSNPLRALAEARQGANNLKGNVDE